MSGSAFGPGVPPGDPWHDDPEFLAWAQDVRANMVPKLEASALSVTIYSGKVDVKLAVELGYALLLGKPLIFAVTPGVSVPDGLARAAAAIVDFDPDDPAASRERMAAVVERVLAEGGLGDPLRAEVATITCPVCGATSAHPRDMAEGYCGGCHAWTSSPATSGGCA